MTVTDSIRNLETLAGDDKKWPSQVKQMRLKRVIVDAKVVEGNTGDQVACDCIINDLSRLIKVWEEYLRRGNYHAQMQGETNAALISCHLDIAETTELQQYLDDTAQKDPERKGIIGALTTSLQQGLHSMKMKSIKEHLESQATLLQKILTAQEEKMVINQMNKRITGDNISLQQQKEMERMLLENISAQTKKLAALDDAIWGMGWKSRRAALEEKLRGLHKQLKDHDTQDLVIEEAWAKRLRDKGLDEASLQHELDSKHQSIITIKTTLAMGDQRIVDARHKIQTQREVVDGNDAKISSAICQLNNVRCEIEIIKGPGNFEDEQFHIDQTTDARGHTFLMVSAQNNDLETAKLCIELGACPNILNGERLMAIDYSYFFCFDDITSIIMKNGGNAPQAQIETLDRLKIASQSYTESSIGWDDALKVANTASRPAELLTAEEYEDNDDLRMPEISSCGYTGFEACLTNKNINSDQVHRVVLLGGDVYQWLMTSDSAATANFVDILEGLKPAAVRRSGVEQTIVHRRAIVGTASATTFEVLAA
jgi:hypothetical protein